MRFSKIIVVLAGALALAAASPVQMLAAAPSAGNLTVQASTNLTERASEAGPAPFKSRNWSGLVLNARPGERFTAVSGTIVVPAPDPPNASRRKGQWVGAAWVGLDGTPDTRISSDVLIRSSLMQAGIVWIVKRDNRGRVTREYEAFTEWPPQTEQRLDGFQVSAGDTLTLTCAIQSALSGYCSFYNHRTQKYKLVPMGAPDTTAFVDGHSAEWIIEDTYLIPQPTLLSLITHPHLGPPEIEPFANYKQVEFSQAVVMDTDGTQHGVSGAREFELVTPDYSTILSQCRAASHFRMLCKYGGW